MAKRKKTHNENLQSSPAPDARGANVGDAGRVPSTSGTTAEPTATRPGMAAAGDRHSSATRDTQDRIAWRAYEIYLERGGGDGRDMDDWLEAERQVSGRRPLTRE